MSKFFEELKRRNVIKSTIAYLVIAWVLLQVFTVLLPIVNAPDWILKGITLVLAIGLPIWIIVSWVYDITPQGIEKTSYDSKNDLRRHATNKRLNAFIISSLSIAVVVMGLKISGVFSSNSGEGYAIAVLPFINRSDDSEQEFFSDGISEDIINMLAQVPELKVIGRTSSFAFKGKNMDLKLIGEQLNVTHILDGSVRRSGNTLRITAQLIKVEDGSNMYSDKFDREIADVFDIQDEISEEILSAVKIRLLGKEKEAILKNDTENIEAYQMLLKGRYHYNKFTPTDLMKAIEYYKSAIAIDPNYALAYAEIASCYGDAYAFKWLPKEVSYPQANSAAEKAIQLDNKIAESHIAIARIKLWSEWDFTTALQELNKGLEINPNSIVGNRQMRILNLFLENEEAAYKYEQKADELDPFSNFNLFLLGAHTMKESNYDSMLEYGNRLVSMDPNFHGGHTLIGIAQLYNKKNEEGIKELELAATIMGYRDVFTLGFLGMGYGISGDKAKAMEIIGKLDEFPFKKEELSLEYGLIYASIGEWDKSFKQLEDGIYMQAGNSLYIPSFLPHWFPEIKDNPRTKQLSKLIDSKIK
jgi:adenylate cyclase